MGRDRATEQFCHGQARPRQEDRGAVMIMGMGGAFVFSAFD
eukprot:COSAG01_NODE_20649_length_943_cov_0.547393_2_plen_40_part_01